MKVDDATGDLRIAHSAKWLAAGLPLVVVTMLGSLYWMYKANEADKDSDRKTGHADNLVQPVVGIDNERKATGKEPKERVRTSGLRSRLRGMYETRFGGRTPRRSPLSNDVEQGK
jgi:hypothetical protein